MPGREGSCPEAPTKISKTGHKKRHHRHRRKRAKPRNRKQPEVRTWERRSGWTKNGETPPGALETKKALKNDCGNSLYWGYPRGVGSYGHPGAM